MVDTANELGMEKPANGALAAVLDAVLRQLCNTPGADTLGHALRVLPEYGSAAPGRNPLLSRRVARGDAAFAWLGPFRVTAQDILVPKLQLGLGGDFSNHAMPDTRDVRISLSWSPLGRAGGPSLHASTRARMRWLGCTARVKTPARPCAPGYIHPPAAVVKANVPRRLSQQRPRIRVQPQRGCQSRCPGAQVLHVMS